MQKCTLSLKLNSNQFHTGLNEICRHFESNRSDEHLNALVEAVENTKDMLFEAIKKELVREGIKHESSLLRERLASLTHYIDSFKYESDAEVKAAAMALKRQLRNYDTFNRMDVHSRLTEVQAMLRDFDTPEIQVHVAKIPSLSNRIANVRTAMEALLNRLVVLEELRGEAKPSKSKVELKREAADKLERLVVYLDGMAYKDPDAYGKEYGVVSGIIANINNTYKTKARRRLEPYEEEYDGGLDETIEEESDAPEPPQVPESSDNPAASATPKGE